jgi:hypothetical protein
VLLLLDTIVGKGKSHVVCRTLHWRADCIIVMADLSAKGIGAKELSVWFQDTNKPSSPHCEPPLCGQSTYLLYIFTLALPYLGPMSLLASS